MLTSFLFLVALAQSPGPPPELSSPFVPNVGQWDLPVDFVARAGDTRIAVDRSGILLVRTSVTSPDSRRHEVVRLRLRDADSTRAPVGRHPVPWPSHFFLGNEPARWASGIPSYREIAMPGLASHWTIRWVRGGMLLTAQRGVADPSDWVVEGGELLGDAAGRFILRGEAGLVCPISFDGPPGTLGGSMPSDTGAACDPATAVTHPIQGLDWSTFFGGSGGEGVGVLALREDGSVIVAGIAGSNDFPVTPGVWDEEYSGGVGSGPGDIFVSEFDASGSQLRWSTFLGGTSNEVPEALLLEEDGSVVIAGWAAGNFPTTPGAFQLTFSGSTDGFIARLAADGSDLLMSTALGGTSIDDIRAIVKRADGRFVMTGHTQSIDFPVTSTSLPSGPLGFPGNAYLAVLDETGADLEYSATFGGPSVDAGKAVVLDELGRAFVVGQTGAGFPTTPGALQPTALGSGDAFVACIDPSADQLVSATYFGGSGVDDAEAVAIDPHGWVVLMGDTEGDIPVTPDAFDLSWNGFEDTFIAKLDLGLTEVLYSSYIGGIRRDFGWDMVVESTGAVVVGGTTDSNVFPVTSGATQVTKSTTATERDCFVYRLSPDGRSLHYATYLGGEDDDAFTDLALRLDAAGAATIGSSSLSSDFPTTVGAFATKKNEPASDAVIARLTLLPRGVSSYGTSTPGCSGPLALGVTAMPALGPTKSAMTCSNAPRSSNQGFFVVSLGDLPGPLSVAGAGLWVNPTQVIALLPARADEVGYSERRLRVPGHAPITGIEVFVQAFWHDPCAPASLSASNALRIKL
jgi:hypothetical protein